MQVRIIKCSEPHWWYVDQLGEVFQVEPFMDSGHYVVDAGNDKKLLINPEDCAILDN